MDRRQSDPLDPPHQPTLRLALLVVGWVSVGLGFMGAMLPVMPTTPFLLVAVWAFARSSPRFHDWLYAHPWFGPTLRAWRDNRVIPVRIKVTALATMAASFLYVTVAVAESWLLPAGLASVMVPTALWLVTRASTPPADLEDSFGEREPQAEEA